MLLVIWQTSAAENRLITSLKIYIYTTALWYIHVMIVIIYKK